ncbi:MAG: aminopeptidase P family protein [Thermoplasmata archaeon]|nr:MAG: aminopeptidase P family protein [Aciduliprofundum sp.]
MDALERIGKLKENMRGIADYAFITPGTNFYYFTKLDISGSMERLLLLIIHSEKDPYVLAPKMYEDELDKIKMDVYLWKDDENPYELLKKLVNFKDKRILIEDNMPSGIFLRIMESLKGNIFLPLSPVMVNLRIIKDAEESEFMKKSAEIVDRVFLKLTSENLKGMTELELSRIIENYIKYYGGDKTSFDPIVASGSNSSKPHHSPDNTTIKNGDPVILDYGAKYRGYCSDITRTVFIGEISKEEKKVYEIVKMAQESAISAVKPGKRASEIDMVARKIISDHGYGEFFIHRTGHGLGLDVHEEPYINSVNNLILENGMFFTIEPGIYIPGKFGVRIEDDVFLYNKGQEITKSEKMIEIL